MAHSFFDTKGIRRRVYGCPLKQRQELAEALGALRMAIANSHEKTIANLYDYDDEFRAIAHDCLELCKVDPNWLDIDMLAEFLLPIGDQPAILDALNFPPVEPGKGGGQSYEEAIAAVWSHTESLDAALRAVGYAEGEQLPWDQLAKVLDARAIAMDPEAKAKAEEAEGLKELAEMAIAGNFFSGFDGGMAGDVFATPEV